MDSSISLNVDLKKLNKVEGCMSRIAEELRLSAINAIGRKAKVISFSYAPSQYKGLEQIWLRTDEMKLYTSIIKDGVAVCDYQEVKENVPGR